MDLLSHWKKGATGPYATEIRQRLTGIAKKRWQTVFQDILSDLIDGASLTSAGVSDLNDNSDTISLKYEVSAPGYAQRLGSLFLFRSCALGRKASDLLETKPRKQPIEFAHAASESDTVTISLPSEYVIEEKPEPVKYDYGFASYKNDTTIAEHMIQCTRTYEVSDVRIPPERLPDLKRLYREIAADEGAYTVLKKP